MKSQIPHSARARRIPGAKRLLIAALALFTVAAVAACVPPSGGHGGGTTPPTAITITASSATIAYGDAVPAITPTYAGLPSGHTETATPPNCATTATSTSPPGTYQTLCAGAADGTTTINYVNGAIHITPAPVVVTASSASMDVGGAVPTITASYTGLVNGDTAPAVLPSCSTTATSASAAGTYSSSCSGASDPNYSFTYVDGVVGVGTVEVTVTASSPSSTYGSDAPTITPHYAGFVNGDTAPATAPTCSTTATSSSPVGSYTSSCSGAADPNYTFVYVDGSVSVDPAPVVVTASSATVPFTIAPSAITASYSGLVNGDTAPATEPTCSTTATAASSVGVYPSTCSGAADPNYTFTYVDGTITVTTGSVPVTVTASSATTTYGDSIPDVTASYAGFSGGQTDPATAATCSTSATSSSPAGTYATTCSGASDPNYDFVYVDGSITILPKDATVTASSDTMTYGGSVPTITPSYSGLVNGDTAAATAPTCSTTATSSSPVGTYSSTCVGAADPSYTFSTVDGTVDVTKADATITASDATFVYGGSVPAITPSYSGLVNGDTAAATAPTCSTTATSSSPVASYPSTCSGADDPNYTFGYVNGSVSVTPKAATITASSPTTTYGTAATVTPSYSGLVNGDTGAATAPTCSTDADGLTVGTFTSTCSGAADPNYTFSYVDGTVTVNPAPVVITASSANVYENHTVPAITAAYSGLKNGETAPATPATCSTPADGTIVGTFASTCSGADDPHYTFTYVDGTVTVTRPTVTVTASSADVEINGTVPAITASYSGFIDGDTALATPATCSTSATSTAIGRFDSTCSGAADAKYDIVYVAGLVTIHPSDGYGEYQPNAHTTTIAAASNGGNLASNIVLNVASASAFQTYQNLTVQSTNGAQSYFCKAHSATQFSTCTANGATGTVATGGWVSDAGPHQFDVYTVAGGKTAVTNTSLTILNDAPAASRGIPSYTTATANNGLITYVQSANPTGTVDLTYGICRTGTATYSSTNPNCSTGVIHYGPGVSSNMGADVTVTVIVTITTHVYQTITNAMFVPATVNPGQTYKVRIAPSVAQIPKLQSSSSGDATVNNSRRFTSVFPIPAGATYVSGRLIGGDAKLQPNATLTYCTTTGTAPCIGKVTGNFDQTTLPYVIVQVPDAINTVLGGQTATMPTVELTLTAGPTSGTQSKWFLGETVNVTSATLIVSTAATFDGYPTNPANLTVTPPKAAPLILATTTIN